MRIIYFDIDSLRPDHLGCYGYHRTTSPNIDAIAAQAVRFTNCHASDVPCLPSRTSLFSGRFGIHTGVINHGGVAAQPFIEGVHRGFQDSLAHKCWMRCLRRAGMHTNTISPFGERHAAWWWYAGFSEIHNTGGGGGESAHEVSPVAIDWINRNGKSENWFLHVNIWDPHTPYRAPDEFIDFFKNQPLPKWLTEETRAKHWNECGPHSAQEVNGFDGEEAFKGRFPRQPFQMQSMDDVRRMFDGYDGGVRYADEHLGKILAALAAQGVLEDTVIIISSDHGENLGELNIYGDHQTADLITTRVPMIIRWPGVTDTQKGRVDDSLIHPNDVAATTIALLKQGVPRSWDGRSFADAFTNARDARLRDYVVVSQGAWSCQRGVRSNSGDRQFIAIKSYHDGYHGFPDWMLFDADADPHEQFDLAEQHPQLVQEAAALLDEWLQEMMRTATHPNDPMWTVMTEGGAFHTRGKLPAYLKRLRETGREESARMLEEKHPKDIQW